MQIIWERKFPDISISHITKQIASAWEMANKNNFLAGFKYIRFKVANEVFRLLTLQTEELQQ